MRRILLIETSPTLRHAMQKLLADQGYQIEAYSEFDAGLYYLVNQLDELDGVVIGWPDETYASTDELLSLLCEPAYGHVPLVILGHDADSSKLSWVSGRTHTAFLLWNSYEDTIQVLPKILTEQFVEPSLDFETDCQIRILLVDDSPTSRTKFTKLLEESGYHITIAANATEGMQKALKDRFDIAIIDYFLPDENGDGLCKRFRSHPHTASIIPAVLTSSYLDKVIQSSLAAGAVECMFKNESDDLFKARVAAMSRNIRITKRIEHERTYLEGILSSVGDGVYGVNKDGLITFVNPATYQILGYPIETNLIGHHPSSLFHRSESFDPNISQAELHYVEQAVNYGKELHGVETIFTRADGAQIQVELTIFPLHIEGQQEGSVVAFRNVSERKLLEDELKWQANHDPLTKLVNRKYMEEAVDQDVQRLKRSNEHSALLYLDLDRFKYINDTIGHAAGDQLLIEVGQQLKKRLRKSDLLARLGGDEFGILLRNIKQNKVFEVADEFRNILANYEFIREGRIYKVHASIGVSMIDKETKSYGEVLSNADIACHIAKGTGRNATHIYTHEQDDKMAMDIELGWSTRLHQALEEDNFQLYYQPILALADLDLDDLPSEGNLCEYLSKTQSRHCDTYEVLLRLHNNHGEAISPNAFLPTAERFNMMPDIDKWVIQAVMKRMAQLDKENQEVTFTINLSGQSLDPAMLVPLISEGIEKYKLNPSRFLFEITESCAVHDIYSACGLIDQLSRIGCRFALDDFGSGYCSFSHLKRLPVDYIKIDGMFVKDILTDPMDMAIIRSITNIAHTLGKQTVAEFVESADVIRLLKECGVDYIQGFYVAKPNPHLICNTQHNQQIVG